MEKLCLGFLLTLSLVLGSTDLSRGSVINFDNGRPGELPTGWSPELTGEGSPVWLLDKDESAPSKPLVLKQSGWTAKPNYPLCVLTNVSVQDGFVAVKFKPMSGTNDQAAGLVWRHRDNNNYYIARANASEENVVLYKVEKGKRKALDIVGRKGGYGVKAKVPAQQWSTLRVEFAGDRFDVSLNGERLFSVEDSTFKEAGNIGVWTKADSITAFDDFAFAQKTKAQGRKALLLRPQR